jgi:hypothetical protein
MVVVKQDRVELSSLFCHGESSIPAGVSSPTLDVRGGSGRELLPALSGFGNRQAARPLILEGTVTNVAAFGVPRSYRSQSGWAKRIG